MSESDFFENLGLSLFEFFSCEMVESGIEVEKLISCEILIEIGVLRHETYLIANIRIIDRTSENFHFACCRSHDTEDTLHRSGLSSAIGPEKSKHFPLREEEVNILEQCRLSDFFGKVMDLESVSHVIRGLSVYGFLIFCSLVGVVV